MGNQPEERNEREMISFKKDDIFRVAQDVDAMVNSVNCRGVMGRGLALQFKERFPENFREYQERCRDASMKPGDLFRAREQGRRAELHHQLCDQGSLEGQ